MISDSKESITVESVVDGIKIYDNHQITAVDMQKEDLDSRVLIDIH